MLPRTSLPSRKAQGNPQLNDSHVRLGWPRPAWCSGKNCDFQIGLRARVRRIFTLRWLGRELHFRTRARGRNRLIRAASANRYGAIGSQIVAPFYGSVCVQEGARPRIVVVPWSPKSFGRLARLRGVQH